MATPVKRGLGDSVFLVKTLEKILNDKETKRSQHQRLRRACEDALSELLVCTLNSCWNNSWVLKIESSFFSKELNIFV